jgi:hypothetical protein
MQNKQYHNITLPRETQDGRDNFDAFEKAGFRIGAAANDTHIHASLPAGWQLSRGAAGMSSKMALYDDAGRTRGYIGTTSASLYTRFCVDAGRIAHLGNGLEVVGIIFNDRAAKSFSAGNIRTVSPYAYDTVNKEGQRIYEFVGDGLREEKAVYYTRRQALLERLAINAAQKVKGLLPDFNETSAYWDKDLTLQVRKLTHALPQAAAEAHRKTKMSLGDLLPRDFKP